MGVKVLGDPNNAKHCSSDIIISNLNNAAKKIGIYDDNGYNIVYDCIGNSHGHNPDAFIVVYELIFPAFILNQVYPKPMFGVSRDNVEFMKQGGYPDNLCNLAHLGVDTNVWQFREKQKIQGKFRLLGIGESNTRGGLELVVRNFCEEFANSNSVELYLRDRNAAPIFKQWVQQQANIHNVTIIHDDRHLENFEEEKDIFYSADAAICLNKSSTWNLRTIESMSTGTPLIVIPYAGPRDYSIDNESAIHVQYDLSDIDLNVLNSLQQIGLKNYLFNPQMHPQIPVWSMPNNDSVKEKMREVVENSDLRNKVSIGGAEYVKQFTWEKSVEKLYDTMLSYQDRE